MGITEANRGLIEGCKNYTNVTTIETSECEDFPYYIAGICRYNNGIINKCTNYGNFNFSDGLVAGIAYRTEALYEYDYDILNMVRVDSTGVIENCINYGNITQNSKCSDETMYEISGIVLEAENCVVKNSINIGHIVSNTSLGIAGIVFNKRYDITYTENCSDIENCLNTGKIIFSQNIGGGFSTGITSVDNKKITNCLNIGYVDNSAIAYTIDIQNSNYDSINNNYYDKQMCLVGGIDGEDIEGKAEGRFTTQLVGTSPELQAMLGDGWSYAEGRYPIPLGLENDTLALIAATPIYLRHDSDDDYDDVEYVTKNFTVGTDNDVTWSASEDRINFDGENATLMRLGETEVAVSANGYSKKVILNIVALETTIIGQEPASANVEIFPNPASEYINLQLTENLADKVEICDMSGKIMLTQAVKTDELQLFVGRLKAGSYVVNLYKDGKNVCAIRFVRE